MFWPIPTALGSDNHTQGFRNSDRPTLHKGVYKFRSPHCMQGFASLDHSTLHTGVNEIRPPHTAYIGLRVLSISHCMQWFGSLDYCMQGLTTIHCMQWFLNSNHYRLHPCLLVLSVPCSLVVTCWERADLLVPLCVIFSCVFVTFPYGVLCQVWYLIVSIPDRWLLPYLTSFTGFIQASSCKI